MATGNITRLEGVWPETHERAVRDSAGVNLETKLGNINSNISQLSQKANNNAEYYSFFDRTYRSVTKKYINTSGDIGTSVDVASPTGNNTFEYLILEVTAGQRIRVKGEGGGAPRLWAFTDSSYVLLSHSAASLTAPNYIDLIAPANGYFISNAKISGTSYPHDVQVGVVLSAVKTDVSKLETVVNGKDFNVLHFINTEILLNERIANAGYITNPAQGYWRTNAIPVSPGDIYVSTGENVNVNFYFFFYTSEKISSGTLVSYVAGRSATVPQTATHMVIYNVTAQNPPTTAIVCKSTDIDTTYPTFGMSTIRGGVYQKEAIDKMVEDADAKWYPDVFSLDITSVSSQKRVLYISENDTLYGSNGYREIFRATKVDLSDYVKVCELPVQARLSNLLFIDPATAVGYVRSGTADATVEGFYVFTNADTDNWTATRKGKMDYGFPGENFQSFIIADNGYLFASEYSIKSEEHASNKIYRSIDGGETWSACYTHIVSSNTHMHAIAFDKFRQRVWCAIGDNGAGGRPGWVYSDDYGNTWTFVEAADGQTVFMDTAIIPTRRYVLIGSDMHPAGIRKWEPADDVKNAPVLASEVTHLYDIPVEGSQNFGFARMPIVDTSVYPYRIAVSFAYTQTYSHACILLSPDFKEWHMIDYVDDPVNNPFWSALSGITSDGWVIGYDEEHGLYRYFKYPGWVKN